MDDKTLSSAIVRFSARFLDELDKTKSVVSSPLSAEILLALLALGATEKTHDELLTELGFPDDDAIRTAFAQLTERLKNINDATLNVANKIYMKKGAELEPQMQKDAEQVFDTGFEVMDFKDGAAVAKNVNDWVDEKTHNKIQKILMPNDVNEDHEMILINAIYFKGNWQLPFDKNKTTDQEFYVDDHTTILVPMMREMKKFMYATCGTLEAEFLVLPYIGDDSKMAIILPYSKEPESVNNVLKKITKGYDLMEKINSITVSSRKTVVNLPKFKIETEIKLNDVLKKLGIKTIFEKANGLNKLLKSKRPIHVSEAIQKAVIEVNEEGTEAAASTKMMMQLCCGPRRFTANHAFLYTIIGPGDVPLFVVMIQKRCGPRHFTADHPFLHVLIGPSDTPLFVGIYRGDENAPRSEKRSNDTCDVEIFSVEN